MVKNLLKRILSGPERRSVEQQFEVIVDELTDSPDKLFVWQFPEFTEPEMEELYEVVLADLVEYGMESEHVFIAGEVDIDELVDKDDKIIRARDRVYEEVKNEQSQY